MSKILMSLVVLGSLTLAGCAVSDRPLRMQGKYYMVGGSNCAKQWISPGTDILNCYTSGGRYTGDRYPMNSQDIQMYQYEQNRRDAMNNRPVVQCTTYFGVTTCY